MTEIFKKLADNGITPNAFYILNCIKEGIVPNTYVKASLEVTRLIRDSWLTENLELTDKSIIFTVEIDGYFKKSKKKTSTNLLGFRWFFETYNYDWETIFQATQKYVAEYESKNYEYMRTAQYFLRKQNVDKSWDSDLAIYCEYLKDNPDDDKVYFSELIV